MNWEKLRSSDRTTFKNPNFQSLCELRKTWKYNRRSRIKNPNFESLDELGVMSKFKFHFWKLDEEFTQGWPHFELIMINDIFHLLTFQEFIKKLEKMFSTEKNWILHPLQILCIPQYHRRFDLKKGPANTPIDNNANINSNRKTKSTEECCN